MMIPERLPKEILIKISVKLSTILLKDENKTSISLSEWLTHTHYYLQYPKSKLSFSKNPFGTIWLNWSKLKISVLKIGLNQNVNNFDRPKFAKIVIQHNLCLGYCILAAFSVSNFGYFSQMNNINSWKMAIFKT